MPLFKVWLVQYRQEIIEASTVQEAEHIAKERYPGFRLEGPTDGPMREAKALGRLDESDEQEEHQL